VIVTWAFLLFVFWRYGPKWDKNSTSPTKVKPWSIFLKIGVGTMVLYSIIGPIFLSSPYPRVYRMGGLGVSFAFIILWRIASVQIHKSDKNCPKNPDS
jgi:protein-S-isoprenylcysteine O-methyltransferase Ste14